MSTVPFFCSFRYTPSASSSSSKAEGAPVTSMAFSPVSNILAFTDSTGSFVRWSDPVPSTLPHPAETFGAAAKGRVAPARGQSPLFGEDDEEDDAKDDRAARKGKGKETEETSDDGYADDWIIDEDEDEGAFKGLLKKDEGAGRWDGNGREVGKYTRLIVFRSTHRGFGSSD